jgi:hypothetical protein
MRTPGLFTSMIILSIASLSAALSVWGAGGNPQFTITEVSTTREKVMNIDHATRKVTLQDEKGKVRTIQVGDAVRNLDSVRAGDEVAIEVHTDIRAEVQPGRGEDTMNIGSESQTSSLPGAKPSGKRTIEGKLKTRVEAVDHDARTITFKGRNGMLRTYRIGTQVEGFNEIRRGDLLVVDYSQTMTLDVK